MKIEILDYNPAWPTAFENEQRRLLAVGFPVGTRIEHIGSTAVPDLAAKPIIDIMIGLAEEPMLDRFVPAVVGLGYEYVQAFEESMPFRRYFRKEQNGMRTHHIHMVVAETRFWKEHLLFRNHLRRVSKERQAYESLKRHLAERDWPSMDDYAAAKNEFITDAKSRAQKIQPS